LGFFLDFGKSERASKRASKREKQHASVTQICSTHLVWPSFAIGESSSFATMTAAMSAPVHGYASAPHMAAVSNTLHLALARLRCQAWFEWQVGG